MAVTRQAPWWLGWLLLGGLALLFVGERVLGGTAIARALLSGAGALVVLGCVAWRALAWRAAAAAGDADARRVQGWLLLAYAGCALALVGYLLASEDGMRWLGIELADEEARTRWRISLLVLWTTLLAVSLVPALGAQFALGEHRHARGAAAGVESYRVLETARSGLVVALAGATLMLVGYLASAKDEVLDLSYFRTATPGEATEAAVSALDQPLDVLLFFPEVSPVKDEVLRYFGALDDATGGVRIEEHDRLADPALATEYQITQDGTILFRLGDRIERLDVGATLERARPTLRALDRRFQSVILPMLRRRPYVYLTSGHGELNDSLTRANAGEPLGGTEALQQLLGFIGYEPRELGLLAGLGAEVPEDAAVVMVLGPRRPFLPEELAALDRYVARGGSLLLALDPGADFDMGPLEERLGVRFVDVPLANEEEHLRQTGSLSDRRLIVTNRVTSHRSNLTLASAGMNAAVLMVGPGYLEPADGAVADPTFVVRALPSTFADLNADFRYQEERETQDTYGLVAAVEPPLDPDAAGVAAGAAAAEPASESADDSAGDSAADSAADPAVDTAADGARNPFAAAAVREPPANARALVFASSSPFTDAVLPSVGTDAALVADGLRWLAREEDLGGETESEEDIPIRHTREENVLWFHATILGAPTLLLALGLVGVYRRRQRRTA